MKKVLGVLFLALVLVGYSQPAAAFVLGDVNADNKVDLTEAVYALQVSSGSRTTATAGATIDVPGQVATIQGAIDAAVSGDVINIAAGTYTGALILKNKALTFQGAGTGQTILQGAAGADVLTIEGARDVLVSGVTVQGGKDGIVARIGASVEVNGCVVQNTGGRGIFIDMRSGVTLSNVTVSGSADQGIFAFRGSGIRFLNTVASNANAMDGIIVLDGSYAALSNAAVTTDGNNRHGVNIINGSALYLDNSSLVSRNGKGTTANNGRGIQVFGSSSIQLHNGSSLLSEDNGLDGLNIGGASSFSLTDSTSSLTIRNATRLGINLWGTSHAHFFGPVLVEKNKGSGGSGIVATQTSAIYIANTVNVLDNVNQGIFAGDSSSIRVDTSGTLNVTSATGQGISLGQNASLSIYGTVNLQGNLNKGLILTSSTVQVNPSGSLTVSGTTGVGDGIHVSGNSSLGVNGNLLIENNTGTSGAGINLSNGSEATLYPSTSKSVVVRNNKYGVNAWNGCGIAGGTSSSTLNLSGNTTKDIRFFFGCRVSVPTTSYSTIECGNNSINTMGEDCP